MGREGQKGQGLSVWLPLALRPTDLDAASEGPVDAAEMADERLLESPDLVGDPVESSVRSRALGQRREQRLAGSNAAPEPFEPHQVGHRSVLVATGIVETRASPAAEPGRIDESGIADRTCIGTNAD